MILLKTVVLFVLVNLAEFYPYLPKDVEGKPCRKCSRYIENEKVPAYLKKKLVDLQKNKEKYCGISNSKPIIVGTGSTWTGSSWNKGDPNIIMKNNNITTAKNSKIIGGSEAQKHEFPWQVGIAFGFGSDTQCGGSIVSSKSILTAAHCVQSVAYNPSKGEKFPLRKCIYAVVDDHDNSKPSNGERWNRICNVKVHKRYRGDVYERSLTHLFKGYVLHTYNEYDYAVLTMCKELLFTDQVAPVCLPSPIQGSTYDDYENRIVIASGWGSAGPEEDYPTKLKKANMKTISNGDCFTLKGFSLSKWSYRMNSPSKICAIPVNGDASHGDSGGPLVIQESQNFISYFTLIGVTSVCDSLGKKPTVFAKVTEVMDWFDEKDSTIEGSRGKHPALPQGSGPAVCTNTKSIELMKDSKNSRSLKNTGGVTYYHFEKDKKLSRMNAEKTCISKYGGQLTSINTQDEYDWIKEQVKDLKMFGQIAIGGQWKDKSSRKFEWTDESEMDMSVLNANWFRTRNYQFPSYKNKKRINLELWYSRRALGFANALDHKAPTMYICKVADSCSA